ncbi:DUF2798 domain-containing protein [Humitalea sp. 24SJ18S-53]|uniref:DUF2798 domain-containing protein n=1 Tax=Humitalea sp. 24SJ18S-53 TaxID=3422307 RepID=UPI003D66B83A
MRFSPGHAPFLFALIVAGIQTFIISAISVGAGMAPDFDGYLARWMRAWAMSWAIAFPILTVLAPLVRRFVTRITAPS